LSDGRERLTDFGPHQLRSLLGIFVAHSQGTGSKAGN
jgi:hypothetical protein